MVVSVLLLVQDLRVGRNENKTPGCCDCGGVDGDAGNEGGRGGWMAGWLVGGGTIHLSTLLMVRSRIVGAMMVSGPNALHKQHPSRFYSSATPLLSCPALLPIL